MYNEKYLKDKIKSYNRKINTNFHNNKIPKQSYKLIRVSLGLIDSVFGTGKNYYPQVFVEEFKHVVKEKKMPGYITDDTAISPDYDREDSDEENSNEENSDEENFDEKI